MVQDKGEIQKIHPVQFSSQIEKYYSFYENLKMEDDEDKNSSGKRKRKHRVISTDTAIAIEQCRKYFEHEASMKKRSNVSQVVKRVADCFDISPIKILKFEKVKSPLPLSIEA